MKIGKVDVKMKIVNYKFLIRSLLIYIIFTFVMIFLIISKKNFHIDEIASYGLSNSVGSISLSFEDGVKYGQKNLPYVDFLTVTSEEDRFNYKNVWENQSLDVHPPLYYVLLHTICSFFPGTFNIFFAGTINIIFGLLTLYMIRKVIYTLFHDKNLVDISSLLFCITGGVLEAVSFLRMYMMTMFFVTWITYLFIVFSEVEHITIKKWLKLVVVTILGALTHYYFIVYLFFICLVYGGYLLYKK